MSLNKYLAVVFFCALFTFGACNEDDPCEDFVCEANKRPLENPVTSTCFCVCADGFVDADCTLTRAEFDDAALKAYFEENQIEAIAAPSGSGLYYVINEAGPGTSDTPDLDNTVSANYSGYFVDDNDNIFDAGTLDLPLGSLIPGFGEGMTYFQIGDKGQLFIPSGLAYGGNPPVGIPVNANLIFDVELLDFE